MADRWAWILAWLAVALLLVDQPWLSGASLIILIALSRRLGFPDVSGGWGYTWLAFLLSSPILHVVRNEAGVLGYGDGRVWLPATLIALSSSISLAMIRVELRVAERAGETLIKLKLPAMLAFKPRLLVLGLFYVASIILPSLLLGVLVFTALCGTVLIILYRELPPRVRSWRRQAY